MGRSPLLVDTPTPAHTYEQGKATLFIYSVLACGQTIFQYLHWDGILMMFVTIRQARPVVY